MTYVKSKITTMIGGIISLYQFSNNSDTRKSLKYSLIEGIFTAIMCGFFIEYTVPLILLFGGSTIHVSISSSCNILFSSIVQFLSFEFSQLFHNRKRFIVVFIVLQSIVLLACSVSALFIKSISLFILLFALFFVFGSFPLPVWTNIICDYVPESKRGWFFGYRGKIMGIITVACSLIASVVIDRYRALGFSIIFAIAGASRLIAAFNLAKMVEPENKNIPKSNIREFLRELNPEMVKFFIFIPLFCFSINIVSPFFSVLMLKQLHYSYSLYITMMSIFTFTMIFLQKSWGIYVDKNDNVKILKFTSLGISFIPMGWFISTNPIFISFLQIASGFFWSGFNISMSNYLMNNSPEKFKTKTFGYFNAFIGIAFCFGSLFGGLLSKHISIMQLILVSCSFRVIVWRLLAKLKNKNTNNNP